MMTKRMLTLYALMFALLFLAAVNVHPWVTLLAMVGMLGSGCSALLCFMAIGLE